MFGLISFFLKIKDSIVDKIGCDYTAYLFAFINCFLYFFGTLYTKHTNLIFTDLIYYRGLTTCIICYLLTDHSHKLECSKHDIKIVAIRGMLNGFNQSLIYICILVLPITLVHSIANIGPIFVITINWIFLRVHMTLKQLIGAIVAFIGVTVAIG